MVLPGHAVKLIRAWLGHEEANTRMRLAISTLLPAKYSVQYESLPNRGRLSRYTSILSNRIEQREGGALGLPM